MGRQRDPAQIARDRRRIADLYLRGALQSAIAAEVGVDQSTVSRDLKALHEEWLQSTLVDINEAKARELAKIDALEREYWAAWVRSQEDAVTETTETRTGIHGYDRNVTQRVGQAGGAQYLAGVQWCISKRCQILGLDEPQRIEFQESFDLDAWRKNRAERLEELEALKEVDECATPDG